MSFYGYKYSYRLNAQHDIVSDGEHKHAHTFLITLYIQVKNSNDFVPYYIVEKNIEKYFSRFENSFLNEMPEFYDVLTTYENIGNVFYKELAKIINDGNYILQKLEINENPTATYIIN